MKQQENLQEGKGLTRVHIHLCLFLILSEWFFYSKSVEKTPGVMGCCMSRPGQAVDLLLCAFVQITSKALENDLQYAIGNVAACNIIQDDWVDSRSVMVWGGRIAQVLQKDISRLSCDSMFKNMYMSKLPEVILRGSGSTCSSLHWGADTGFAARLMPVL